MTQDFQYTAIDAGGKQSSGVISASTRQQALGLLARRSLQVNSLVTANGKSKQNSGKKKGVNPEQLTLKDRDLISFTEEFGDLLEAGMPLEPALASMEVRDDSGSLQEVSGQLRRRIIEGEPLSEALPKVSPQFNKLYCNLIRAGEESGSLPVILRQHGTYLKKQSDLSSQLRQALIYPAFLVLTCVSVSVIFLFYLLPKMTVLLADMPGAKTPAAIRVAELITETIKNHGITLFVFFCILLIAAKFFTRSAYFQSQKDLWYLKIPFYGIIVSSGFYVQWLQTLGNLISSGLPLVKALELTSETATNRHYQKKLAMMTDEVSEGFKLTRSMRNSGIFTPSLVDLVSVGENTGRLSQSLARAADYYEKRLETRIRAVLKLIPPVILSLMALLVAVLSHTMIQAIYETISQLNKR